MYKSIQVLKQFWGYDSFRPGQAEVIDSILSGHDTLALMPTGGGKSITFQVPALSKPGICLVISPLVALMKDQVKNLQKRGILSAFISSEMPRWEILQQLDNCILGDYKFLYISPERISSDLFQEKLKPLSEKVNLLVVDEAHCISQWGNDFRRDYRLIADIRDAIPRVPVIAVTASATAAVVADICEQLHFRKGYRVFKTSFERKNLSFVVRKTDNKLNELCHILSSVQGSAVVYSRTRRGVEEYAGKLRAAGISAEYFHAGLDPVIKTERQTDWLKGNTRVLVATNAFGMGIDKGDVRLVIHTEFPDSMEAYYQEAGRAGRDGNRAYAVALLGPQDITDIKRRPSNAFPTIEYIKRVYEALCNRFQIAEGDGEGVSVYLNEPEFLRDWHFDKGRLRSSLEILSLSGYLDFEPYPNTHPYLRYDQPRWTMDRFLNEDSPAAKITIEVLRNYEGLFSAGVSVSVDMLARKTGFQPREVAKILGYLRNIGFYYLPSKKEPRITFKMIRVPLERLVITTASYENRLSAFKMRIEKVAEYLQTTGCRQEFISEYFGMEGTRCGYCDNCLRKE
ncbi:RecQ family ATP-dependent DNA helicase [Parabacteroides acidifaciens]|uniref:ATP-dependent DNA helicase RecQ n=1 Tax=Parabacteroides acidifaciens TaxID=2290935 RepID=A0A3D8HFB1_9BACT|nr:RecQ family ATP-dependent DNA helicase [Parabacteroides acidifaciens]MBC8601689.1 RecQ family ATP-dependent DNA helicase [Parabacteroides acidifaciens]RDU49674.1 RecQ family ATP-dependent DNA helicase [Parabacteroides acidifaciens]